MSKKAIIILCLSTIVFTNLYAVNKNINKSQINLKKLNNESDNITFKSKLLKELDIVLTRISKQDKKRQLEMAKEIEKMKIEREKLLKTKESLEKERMLKGIVTKDDVTREQEKINNEKKLLLQKIQYNQTKQQFKSNDIKTYHKIIRNRIKYFKRIKKELKKEFIINSEYYDYLKLNIQRIIYIKSSILKEILKEINIVQKNEDKLNNKITDLKNGLTLETIVDLRQVINNNNINSYRAEKYNNNMLNISNNKSEYIKLIKGQLLGKNIYVKEITPSYIIIKRD